ncbi:MULTISPECIES: CPBP family intramembrane glutamic endopeptidase [Brevibacterium]|uniref:CAAX prenyl protease 2/Lysostaphin resistance protein A-like domain-containing protein n=1 Tax=Brevibacterium salitolerans TaxID=1403566 RepID=A0ABP5IG07_9MICO|nr:type II CAAX endopeptidase family protein [Brevibacterium sp.]
MSIVLVVVAVLVLSTVFSLVAVLIDMFAATARTGTAPAAPGAVAMTPLMLLATNLSLTAAAGVALLAHRFICGLRVPWLHSLRPGFRFRWFWIAAALAGPVYLLFAASSLLDPAYQDLSLTGKALAYLVIIVLTTPLQAAAEEYMFRGVVQRAAGAWAPGRTAALAVGTLVSAALFSAAHFAADPWLIAYYFAFGVGLSLLAHLTGGVEAGIAVHTANNLFLLVLAAAAGEMDAGFDRSAGTGGPFMLVPIVLLALVIAALTWLGRRRRLQTLTPGGQCEDANLPAGTRGEQHEGPPEAHQGYPH